MPLSDLLRNSVPRDEENALECLLSAIASHPTKPSSSFLFQEEQVILELLKSLLYQDGTNKQPGLLDTELVIALQHAAQQILPALSPFQLHATFQQAIVWGGENNEAEDNKNVTTFTLICLVLCCHALMQCPERIVTRRERWRSLLWETLHLFQYYSTSDKPCRIQGGRSTFLFLYLWDNCLVSALARVQNALVAGNEESSADLRERRFQVSWVAATIATTSQLLNQLAIQPTYHNHQGTDHQTAVHLSEKLLHSMQQHVVGTSTRTLESLLCVHPWRLNVSKMKIFSRKEPSFEALLSAYTVSETSNDEDDADNETNNVLTKVQEEMCRVESEWDRTGIALLVASYWHTKPSVWSWEYQWRLFFPHVSSLLLVHRAGQLDQDSMDDAIGEPVDYTEQVQRIGFDLLESLLRVVKTASLGMPSSAYDRPLSPVGLFQLLSNRVVASSVSKASDVLPSAGQTYQRMKDLLAVYTPQTQYKLIQNLVQTCPHPGMKPKLLDLWRGFISWQDVSAVESVLSHVETQYIQRLAHDYLDHSHPNQAIANAEKLVSSAEMFVAALGLIQIWVKMNGSENHDISGSLSPLLSQIKCSLDATFERWTLDNGEQRLDPPLESFRLYLLHDAVTLTMELLS